MSTDEDRLYTIKNKINDIKEVAENPPENPLNNIKNNIETIKNKTQTEKIIDKTVDTSKGALQKVTNTTKKGISKISPIVNKGARKIKEVMENESIKKFFNMLLYILLISVILILILDVKFINDQVKKITQNLLYSLLIIFFINNIVEIVVTPDKLIVQIFILLCIGAATFFFMRFVDQYSMYHKNKTNESPFLLEGLRNGKNSMVISQNPNNPNSIILYRSNNKKNGIEFSYQVWIIVKSTNFKRNESNEPFRHIFHKGDHTGKITQCPSLYLHADKNSLRVNVNTLNEKDNYVDINNIPIDKWVHVSIVVLQNKLEVYINGSLKSTKPLLSLPRQNYGNVWVNLHGGFEGYVSKLRYHRFALHPNDIENYSKDKPNTSSCDIPGEKPSYLSKDWWLSDAESD